MSRSLSELRSLGANWVAIHPYGWIKQDGRVDYRPADSLDFLSTAVALARQAGLEMFWKPHLGYWGQFKWRGDIAFGDDEPAWTRFFEDYRDFITDQAAFAERHGVELFAVGVETEATTHREKEWRQVLAAVREVYSGRVLYAANWRSLDQVPFWDAVDVIGVHAYFPLAADGAAAPPDRQKIAAAWEGPLTTLAALSRRHAKPVVFAEIGYNLSSQAASQPWSYQVEDSPANRELRRRLIEVAIERIEAAPFIEGMFWWKWMPGWGRSRSDFSMRAPEAREAIAKYWLASDPPTTISSAD